MLQLTNIQKHYHSDLALQIPTLKLETGIYFIKGANGSGKTTFLKIIGGLLPFEGDVLLNNISLKSNPVSYRQQVSWAETEPLYPAFVTGLELIKLYSSIRKVSKQEADYLIERYHMNDYLKHAVGTYSAGMTKKLSLVLAFLGKMSFIILDEPFITLDTEAQKTTLSLIMERSTSINTGFLISFHQDMEHEFANAGQTLLVENKTIVFK